VSVARFIILKENSKGPFLVHVALRSDTDLTVTTTHCVMDVI
jgi:hypothetical protein